MNYKFIFLCLSLLYPVSLQEMYDDATSGLGYDKYIQLESNQIYTGSIGVYEGSVLIDGNGAIIDLQNENGIWKNTPNALFKVLFHSKMRKMFVFQYFCDAGIENIMNSHDI